MNNLLEHDTWKPCVMPEAQLSLLHIALVSKTSKLPFKALAPGSAQLQIAQHRPGPYA